MLRPLTSLARATDRRASHRCPTLENRLTVQWWDAVVAHESPARVVDLSAAGALLAVLEPPSISQLIRIRLERPATTDWVDARVVRRAESHEIGVAFRDRCPKSFFDVARPHPPDREPPMNGVLPDRRASAR